MPSGYDPATTSTLFIWLHGCGGTSEFDIESFHATPTQSYITVAPIGAEGACWYTLPDEGESGDELIVARVAADVAEHFNIDAENVVLGGYSSGGDLAYRTGYLFSGAIEAVLAANTAPFQDTGVTPAVLPRPGDHYNDPGQNGLPGTDADITTYLLPQVDP